MTKITEQDVLLVRNFLARETDTGEPLGLVPDFSTPSGFFWMWERLQEKEWFNDFIEKSFDYARKQLQIEGGLYHEPYLKWLINPANLYSAVLAWVKEGEGNV